MTDAPDRLLPVFVMAGRYSSNVAAPHAALPHIIEAAMKRLSPLPSDTLKAIKLAMLDVLVMTLSQMTAHTDENQGGPIGDAKHSMAARLRWITGDIVEAAHDLGHPPASGSEELPRATANPAAFTKAA